LQRFGVLPSKPRIAMITSMLAAIITSMAFAAGAVCAAAPEAAPADPEPTQTPPHRLLPELPSSLFDLRVLQAAPGKLDALHARLRDHQIPLLEQHGVVTLAVFVPAGENPGQLVYLLTATEGLGPMLEGWAGFRRDPQWAEIAKETNRNGDLVVEEDYDRLVRTSWSPRFPPESPIESGVYELRTYTCPDPDKHIALLERFREHTMKLFEKHGMRNIVYWVPDERPASQEQLVYLLGHESREAAKQSFAGFRQDPDWLAAREASEKTAGGSLTVAKTGVVSEFLVPAEYSPLK
jgi:hypothetical protein